MARPLPNLAKDRESAGLTTDQSQFYKDVAVKFMEPITGAKASQCTLDKDFQPSSVAEVGHLLEFSTKETAKVSNISIAAARGRLFHARSVAEILLPCASLSNRENMAK